MKKRIVCLFVALIVSLTCCSIVGCREKTADVTTYNINVTLTENTLYGTEEVCFFNDSDNAFSVLKFNLFANAFRKDAKYSPISFGHLSQAYYQGLNYGEITIKGASQGQHSLEFQIAGIDQNILLVKLVEEVFPNECVTIKIDYEMTIPYVIARTGINKNTINLANFYPILCGISDGAFYECVYYSNGDPYFSDCANYNVTFSHNSDYVVASSGKAIESSLDNDIRKTTYQLKNARSFCLVLSKDFELISDNSLGVEINYYYYDDENAKASLQTAVESVKFFSERFGSYPYSHYSVCQTQFVAGGMEFSALVYISDNLEKSAYNEVIVHETAHQWWQTGVGNNEIEHGFLDEGLAEYSVVLFYENHKEHGLSREQLIEVSEKSFKSFCTVYDKLFNKVDTSMLRNLKDFSSEYEYVNIAYIKPCIMYDTLRKTIGDKKFFMALKKYYQEFCYKNAKPIDLVWAFESVGAKSEGFLTSFFEGKEII